MANYAFSSDGSTAGFDVFDEKKLNIYINGTTSLTYIESGLIDISDLTYDWSSVTEPQAGSVTVSLADYAGEIESNISDIISGTWLVYLDSTVYFRGRPITTTASFSGGVFSVEIVELFDTFESNDFTSLSTIGSAPTAYALSDMIELAIDNDLGISSSNVIYLGDPNYSANGKTVYLDKGSATSGDGYIAVDTSTTKFTWATILGLFALNHAVWKGKFYLWKRDEYSGATTITDSDIVGQIVYYPSYRPSSYGQAVILEHLLYSTEYSHQYLYRRASDELIVTDNDRLRPHESGSNNWGSSVGTNIAQTTDASPDGRIYGVMIPCRIDNQNVTASLAFGNFVAGLSEGDKIEFSFEYETRDFQFSGLATGSYSIVTTFDSNITPEISAIRRKRSRRTKAINAEVKILEDAGDADRMTMTLSESTSGRGEFELRVAGSTSLYMTLDLSEYDVTGTSFTPNLKDLTFGSITIEYDGTRTVLKVPTGGITLSVGDVIEVWSSAEPAFDGYYQVTDVISGGEWYLDRTPYTSDTSAYDCDVWHDHATLTLTNLSARPIKEFETVIVAGDAEDNTFWPLAYEVSAAEIMAVKPNHELADSIMIESLDVYTDRFSSEMKYIEVEVDSEVNPYSRVTYDGVNYLIERWSFSFLTGNTKMTLAEA